MPTRRNLLVGVSALGVAALATSGAHAGEKAADKPAADKSAEKSDKPAAKVAPAGAFTLEPLPYPDTDLVPYISQNTLTYHYGKHHQGYVNKLNELYLGNESLGTTPDAVAKAAFGDKDRTSLYNNAAQAHNHTFLWSSMRKNGGGWPSGKLGDAMKLAFTDEEGWKKAFKESATTQFGSGWAWLVSKEGKVSVVHTANADCPLWTGEGTPLLVLDVWEHAYYLDYQNKRSEYVVAFLDHLVNWDFAAKNFG